MKKKSLYRKSLLLMGSCMLIALYSGCNGYGDNVLSHKAGEPPLGDRFFAPEDSVPAMTRAMNVQAASGARADAMLQAAHFDKGQLNSLGRAKLTAMLDDDDANNPVT